MHSPDQMNAKKTWPAVLQIDISTHSIACMARASSSSSTALSGIKSESDHKSIRPLRTRSLRLRSCTAPSFGHKVAVAVRSAPRPARGIVCIIVNAIKNIVHPGAGANAKINPNVLAAPSPTVREGVLGCSVYC